MLKIWGHSTIALLLVLLLGGCGGGGEGGSKSTFSVSPSSITFTANQGGTLPSAQFLQVSFSNSEAVYVGAAFSGSQPAWLDTPMLSGAGGSWNLSLQVSSTSLIPGSYTARLTVGIAKADKTILATQEIPITYTVSPVLGADLKALTYSYVLSGTVPPSQSVAISGTGFPWQASVGQPWIKLSANSGTAPSTLGVTVDPTGLGVGAHTGTITLVHTGANDSLTISVQFTVSAPDFQPSSTNLTFSGINGTSLTSQNLSFSLNTNAVVAWTAVAAHPWVVLDKVSGQTPDTLAVSIDPSRGPLASGTHLSNITITSSFNGSAIALVVPVTLNLTKATLDVLPTSILFRGASGNDIAPAWLRVGLNTIDQLHSWTATPSASWIIPNPLSGQSSANQGSITRVTVNSIGLASGTYAGTLTISATINGDLLSTAVPVVLIID